MTDPNDKPIPPKPVEPAPMASESERAAYAQAMADWTAAGGKDDAEGDKPSGESVNQEAKD